MTLSTEDYGACGGVSIALAVLPTLAFLISELLPYISEKHKCNGILQTILCGIKHLINKEPCGAEELAAAANNIMSSIPDIEAPEKIDEDII
tara:strand:+ start:1789 stop:2064 length:276 start_codon:yes stop_codon:yes gene_type:complete